MCLLAALPVWSQLTSNSVHTCMISHFSSVWLFVTLWIVAHQAPLSMGFFSKNTGMGYHALLQGILLTQGLNPCLLCLMDWQVVSLLLAPPGKPCATVVFDIGGEKNWKRMHTVQIPYCSRSTVCSILTQMMQILMFILKSLLFNCSVMSNSLWPHRL